MRLTHGLSKTRAYRIWTHMKQRCLNPAVPEYRYYGGRGITVCDRWLHSFENFLADMGDPPDGATLDRRKNDGNYEPDNCRWASHAMQQRNKRNTKLTTSKVQEIRKMIATGITHRQIAAQFGISHMTVSNIRRDHLWRD